MFGDLSQILTFAQYKEVFKEIKTYNPEIRKLLSLQWIYKEDLIQGEFFLRNKLNKHKKKVVEKF